MFLNENYRPLNTSIYTDGVASKICITKLMLKYDIRF